MDIVSYSDARQNLKAIMDRVVADMTQVVVTRQRSEPVVVVSLAEWNSISETLHLLSSPRNAERLLSAIHELDKGKGKERRLVEDGERAIA
jgi:antitoxin YefM